MNYNEENDHDLALSVIYAGDSSLNDSTFYDEILCGRSTKASIYDRESSDLVKSFDINNPADWGKLMEDNQISIKTMPDYLDVTIRGWEAVGSFGLVQQFYNSKSIGRAVSVCYLKIMGANNV